ncbi:hypothetical protein FACS1894182_00750 [Bacteroidia bacterium]|nr:hypothetical protein FACS1894182_00750 [Bacteroidia bacterium]
MIWLFYLLFGAIVLSTCMRLGAKAGGRKSIEWKPLEPWQPKYAGLIENFDSQNPEVFYEEICQLGKRYLPPTARSIFFQAHQFMAKYNSGYSLLLYLQYLHVKTSSATFRHRKVSEEFKKILFRTKMQEATFSQICSLLKEKGNLNQAIDETKRLFHLTRREISLDVPAIEAVSREHLQTAELLGKYLEDEPEMLPEVPVSALVSPENNHEQTLFRLFEENNFMLKKKVLDSFSKNNGLFCSSLIQQINEMYYEALDDLLIEEEGDDYLINKAYYKQIKQCP